MTNNDNHAKEEFSRSRGLTCAFLLLIACVFAYGAWRQSVELNLSETAGGQSPYFSEATRIANEGVANYFGDRNRMPGVPALLSLFHSENTTTYFSRSKSVAILSSIVALIGLSWLFLRRLPGAPAVLAIAITAFAVFLPKASFVQAELLYYALFFATWLFMCQLLYRPNIRTALIVGLMAGLSYWVKASAPPLVVAFIFASLIAAFFRRKGTDSTIAERKQYPSSRDTIISAVLVAITFIAVISPYLLDNKERFGHYFYNVNSTFFMWCDSWNEAKTFADQYNISEHYPEAPTDEIPGASRYLRTHSLSQIAARFSYGFATLARQFFSAAYSRYLLALGAVCVLLAWQQRKRFRELTKYDAVVVMFSLCVIAGYLAVYAWYAPVAFGDRFILSLYLPVLFAELFFISQLATGVIRWKPLGLSLTTSDALAIFLTSIALVHGLCEVVNPLANADTAFVHFYFNESREAQLAGNRDIAIRGYQGVVKLDPTFAAAHHELGLIALRINRSDVALPACREAARLSPDDANYLNSLGSALIQAGATDEAIETWQHATKIDPNFVSALYNLGGAYTTTGQIDRANEIAQRLDALDPRAANRLRTLLPNGQRRDQ